MTSSRPAEEPEPTDGAQDPTHPSGECIMERPRPASTMKPRNPHCDSPSYVLPSTPRNLHPKLPLNRANPNRTLWTEAALPLAPVADEARGTLGHALVVVNHKLLVLAGVRGGDFGAELSGDTAPALELVGVGGTGGQAHALVVVVAAGHARRVVVGCRAAPQALGVATLVLVCASPLPTRAGAHCRVQRKGA